VQNCDQVGKYKVLIITVVIQWTGLSKFSSWKIYENYIRYQTEI